ncbi:MAG: hypothetical protein CMH77_04145 [Nitrospinae bacterium]|nr:hypothetical protein [Nitrospinota bacterium]
MKNNDSGSFWLHIPVLLIKIIRTLTKKPSGQPKTMQLELWGRLIKISTDPEIGRVRMDIITSPMLSIEDKKSNTEDYQPQLDLEGEDVSPENKKLLL